MTAPEPTVLVRSFQRGDGYDRDRVCVGPAAGLWAEHVLQAGHVYVVVQVRCAEAECGRRSGQVVETPAGPLWVSEAESRPFGRLPQGPRVPGWTLVQALRLEEDLGGSASSVERYEGEIVFDGESFSMRDRYAPTGPPPWVDAPRTPTPVCPKHGQLEDITAVQLRTAVAEHRRTGGRLDIPAAVAQR